jgi:tetratricopeptide (TPR) repeat protein
LNIAIKLLRQGFAGYRRGCKSERNAEKNMKQLSNRYSHPDNMGIAKAFVKIGEEYARHEQWAAAMVLYNEAIKRYPELGNAYYQRGLVYKVWEKYHQARDDFDQAIRLGIEDSEVYFNRGYILYRIMRVIPTLALNDYNKAITLNPDCVEAYYWRARLWYETENHHYAIEDYTKVLQLKADYGAAYMGRGSAYYELLQAANAIADYNYLIEKQSYEKMHAVYYNRAIAHWLNNQYDRAIQDYNEAIRIKPDFQEALAGQYEIYIQMMQLQKAIEKATELISLEADEIDHYLKRARAYDKIGEYQKAIDDFTEVIRRSLSFPDVNFERAEAYVKMGLYEEAIADYDYMINHYPYEYGKQKARDKKAIAVRLSSKS